MAHSLRKLINEKCKDCSYDPLDKGTWKAQVEDCRVTKCPLYPVRPVSRKKEIPAKEIQ